MIRVLERASGWAHTTEVDAYVVKPRDMEELRAVIAEARSERRRICPRGAGLSLGDAVVSAHNYIVDLTRLNHVLSWDPATGILVAEPGVTVGQIFEETYPSRWILPSTPGSTAITLGGALGMNTHGKNSWRDGNIGDHVLEFGILALPAQQSPVVETRTRNSFSPPSVVWGFSASLSGSRCN